MSTMTKKTITDRVGYEIINIQSRSDGYAVVECSNDAVYKLTEGSAEIEVGDYAVVISGTMVHYTAQEVGVSWTIT